MRRWPSTHHNIEHGPARPLQVDADRGRKILPHRRRSPAKRRIRAALFAICCAAAASTSCGASDNPIDPTPPKVAATPEIRPAPLMVQGAVRAIRSMRSYRLYIDSATQLLIFRCMTQRGHQILPQRIVNSPAIEFAVMTESVGGADSYGVPLKFPNPTTVSPSTRFAQTHGYGFYDENALSQASDIVNGQKVPRDPFARLAKSEQDKINADLFGQVSGPAESMQEVKPYSKTCVGHAESIIHGARYLRSVRGDPSSRDMQWWPMLALYGQLPAAEEDAPGNKHTWIVAQRSWIDCMSEAGFPGMTDIVASRAVAEMYSGTDSVSATEISYNWAPVGIYRSDPAKARVIEIEVALADSNCAREARLQDAFDERYSEYLTEFVKSNRVRVMSELVRVGERIRNAAHEIARS